MRKFGDLQVLNIHFFFLGKSVCEGVYFFFCKVNVKMVFAHTIPLKFKSIERIMGLRVHSAPKIYHISHVPTFQQILSINLE